MNEVDWKKPALIGGLVVALPALIPFVSYANFCFCLWSWVGGIVAAQMLTTRSPRKLSFGDGAKIGLLAGLIGGVIYLIVSAPLMAWQMDKMVERVAATPNFPAEWAETFLQVQQSFAMRVGIALLSSLIASLIMAGFTVLGGMLGVAIFEKRKDGPIYPPTDPPQDSAAGGWSNP
ncbi:MAG: hypothetical protein ABI882_06005 [Acidobacteriota bacterium]